MVGDDSNADVADLGSVVADRSIVAADWFDCKTQCVVIESNFGKETSNLSNDDRRMATVGLLLVVCPNECPAVGPTQLHVTCPNENKAGINDCPSLVLQINNLHHACATATLFTTAECSAPQAIS